MIATPMLPVPKYTSSALPAAPRARLMSEGLSLETGFVASVALASVNSSWLLIVSPFLSKC